MEENTNNKIIGDFSRVKVRINNNKNNIINSSCKFLLLLIMALLILLVVPSTSANPSIIYGPNGIAIAQVSEDGTLIYAGDGTEFLILNDSNGNIIYKEVVDDSGNILKKEGTQPKDLQRRIDKETGLYWYAYDSTTKTYLQATGIMFKEIGMGIGGLFAEMARSSSPYAGLHVLADPNAVTQYSPRITPTADMIPIYGQIKTIATPMPNENFLNRFLIKGGAGMQLISIGASAGAGICSAVGYNPVIGGGGCAGGGCAVALSPKSVYQYQLLKQQLALQQETGMGSELASIFVTRGLPKEIARSPALAESFMNSKGVVYLPKKGETLNFLITGSMDDEANFVNGAVGPIKSISEVDVKGVKNLLFKGERGVLRASTTGLTMKEQGGPPTIHVHLMMKEFPKKLYLGKQYPEAHIHYPLITMFEYNKFIKDYPCAVFPTGEVVPIRELTNYFLWDPF